MVRGGLVVALGLLSFVLTTSCMFLVLSMTRGFAVMHSSSAAPKEIVNESAFPPVPPIIVRVHDGRFSRLTQQLDGLDCVNCVFKDVTFEYGGGSFHLTNSSFSGPIRVNFKGAAANTLAVLEFIGALNSGSHPQPLKARTPIPQIATSKQGIKVSLASPYGWK